MSVKVTVTAFSLFTAYQFLSSDMCIDTPKIKCDHIHHGWTNGFAPIWWKWSRQAFSLLSAYQFLSADFISQPTWQSCDCKLQYNTCGRRNHFSLLLLIDFIWPHSYHLFSDSWPHVLVSVFLLYSRSFFSLPTEQILSASTVWKQDHMAIIRHSDLTTSLTINRTGVHGDKMSGEYEKAVFA